jgi:hypothetical protein
MAKLPDKAKSHSIFLTADFAQLTMQLCFRPAAPDGLLESEMLFSNIPSCWTTTRPPLCQPK